jgi:ribosomal protein S18 acetylase RimI-like enzyme
VRSSASVIATSIGSRPCAPFLDADDVEPCVELDPFTDYGEDDAFFAGLARHGLAQTGFHQTLIGRPDALGDDVDDGFAVEPVGREAEAAYAMIHERVFGPGLLITALLSHPAFRCFLVSIDGTPVALGVLHVRGKTASMANGITLPEFRGRGLQLTLLRYRIGIARELGCDLIVSQANPRNTSMRNQLRAGLSIAGTKAIWTRLPSQADA